MTPSHSANGAGPRPRRRPAWVERERRRLRHPFYRLLDRSFGFRLLLALAAAGLLLAGVNRWEHCRQQGMAQGCLLADPGGIVSVDNVESLSIVTAAFLYLLERSRRRQRQHVEAMEVLLSHQEAAVPYSLARIHALELLSDSGLWLDGLQLAGAELNELHAPHGRWRGIDLRGASLQQACLHDIDLQDANLQGADLQGADLHHADLRRANLRQANLQGADLRRANLEAANLNGANLNGAELTGANITNAELTGTAPQLSHREQAEPNGNA